MKSLFLFIATLLATSSVGVNAFTACEKNLNLVHFSTRCNGDVAHLPFSGSQTLGPEQTGTQQMYNDAITSYFTQVVVAVDGLPVEVSVTGVKPGEFKLNIFNPSTTETVVLNSGFVTEVIKSAIC